MKTNKKQISKEDLLIAIKKSTKIAELIFKTRCLVPELRELTKLYGIQYPNYRPRAACDEEFFGRKDEKAMYWAGFLAADGCLRSGKSNSIKLELSTADKKQIEKFKRDTKSKAIIHNVIRKPSKLLLKHNAVKNCYYSSWFVINSAKMCNDLFEYSIVPKKTYIYEMPGWLVNHQNVNHFIRGYLDGDGCFTFNKRKGKVVSVKLCLTRASKVVKQIFDIIKDKCDAKYGDYSEYSETNRRFGFNSMADIERIVDFLYSDATVYLERKFNKAKQIKKLIKQSSMHFFKPEELQKLYDELGSFNAVGKVLKCDRGTIRLAMHNLGLRYNSNPEMSRKRSVKTPDKTSKKLISKGPAEDNSEGEELS